ncbi:hypothetical protein B0H11DRAFT_2334108 [Mycena galericulata]|nr:hypothetical protein B0H11DRAFT_2334108 [Mycena galericulata]
MANYGQIQGLLMLLNRHGYVQAVHLHKGNTAVEITDTVTSAFSGVPEMATYCTISTYGFRVLEVLPMKTTTKHGKRSKKSEFRLKPISSDLGMDMWTRAHALATVRDTGSGYKNTIFIALHPAAPNLRFPGTDLDVDTPDHDMDTTSESSDSTDPSGETGNDASMGNSSGSEESDGEAKSRQHAASESKARSNTMRDSEHKERSESKSRSDAMGGTQPKESGGSEMGDSESSSNLSNKHGSPDHKYEPMDQGDVRVLTFDLSRRLLMINWRSTPLSHLKDFNSIIPLLGDLIDSARIGQLHIDFFYTKIDKYITAPLNSMRDLSSQIIYFEHDEELSNHFETLFGVGPGGIDILLPVLTFLYEGLARIRREGFKMSIDSRKTEYTLDETSKGLVICLDHFRATYHRSFWDPKGGFRELAYILRKHGDELPIGDAQNPMHAHLDGMDIRLDPLESLRQALADAFGSATDGGQMKHTVVAGGEYGLGRFYKLIIEPLLDTVERDDYDDVFKLFMDSSRALLALSRENAEIISRPWSETQVNADAKQ